MVKRPDKGRLTVILVASIATCVHTDRPGAGVEVNLRALDPGRLGWGQAVGQGRPAAARGKDLQ